MDVDDPVAILQSAVVAHEPVTAAPASSAPKSSSISMSLKPATPSAAPVAAPLAEPVNEPVADPEPIPPEITPATSVPQTVTDKPGLKEQELLGELQTDEIWWHPKGLVTEDPTKPKKLIGLDQNLLTDVEACLNRKDIRYKERMELVLAAIDKINSAVVNPSVAEVSDTANWSEEEMMQEISRLRMLNAVLNNNLAAWQLRGEHAERDANNMAERLNNLLFHAAKAREMALEGVPTIPKEDRTIHGRAWKFSRGSYPVIGEPDNADDLHNRAAGLKQGGVPQRNLKLGGVGVLWM